VKHQHICDPSEIPNTNTLRSHQDSTHQHICNPTECFWISLRVEFLLKINSGYPGMWKLLYSPWQTLGVPSALTPIGQLHQSPTSPVPGDLGRCPALPGRLGRRKFVLDGLGWKKIHQRTYYSYDDCLVTQHPQV